MSRFFFFFFFNDTATTEIYTLSLHDALPICVRARIVGPFYPQPSLELSSDDAFISQTDLVSYLVTGRPIAELNRSEEHTSELQSRQYLVCRLLLEKKKNKTS